MKTVPVRSAKKIEVKGKMEERSGWRGQNESQIGGEEMRSGRLVGAAETSKELAQWRRLQQKNLSILILLKRKEWPQCHRQSSWQVGQSRSCQYKKEQSRLSRAPDHEAGESQGEREHGEKRVDSTVNEGRFQRGDEGKQEELS